MNFIKSLTILLIVTFASTAHGQNMPDSNNGVIEIATYTVKKEYVGEFSAIRAKVYEVVKNFKGFKSVTELHSIEHPEIYSEIIEWECREDCERARVHAENMPELQPLMNAIEKSLLFEFFTIEKKVLN